MQNHEAVFGLGSRNRTLARSLNPNPETLKILLGVVDRQNGRNRAAVVFMISPFDGPGELLRAVLKL